MAIGDATDPRLGMRLISAYRLAKAEAKVEGAIKRAVRAHQSHAVATLRARTADAAHPDAFNLNAWDTSVDDEVQPDILSTLEDLASGAISLLGLDPVVRAQILGAIDLSTQASTFTERIRGMGNDIAQQLQEQLTLGTGLGESIPKLTQRVMDVFSVAERRGETIARTEVHGAAEETSHLSMGAVADAGLVVTKAWLATADERTRPTHVDADGQEQAYEDTFDVGGSSLMYPGDPDGDPGETINCRCSVVYTADDGSATVEGDAGGSGEGDDGS